MFVGIDIGGTSIKGALTDKNGKVLSFWDDPTPANPKDIEKAILHLIEQLSTSASVSKIDVQAIGIGSAGSIDKKKGVVITSPNIPGLRDYPIVKNLKKATEKNIYLENDATVALIGAWWKGNVSKYRNWLLLTLGTGIGGGAIIDNKVFTGQAGNSMEVGHMTIDVNGKPCSCGNHGCLERYASATALVELTGERLTIDTEKKSSLHKRMEKAPLTADMIHEEAQKKDELARECIETVAASLGVGVANLVNIFNPEAIVFTGGLSQAHKLLLPVVKKTVKERALAGMKENVEYVILKDYAMIPSLGAAKIAMDSENAVNGR